jgi:AcrR family transcriptional regulator
VTSKPGLRERNRARTYAEIANAALDLFERQGYDATTVDQIAASAGVSPATFFRYFATKEDVLFADEESSAAGLVEHVAGRKNRSTTSAAALADPVVGFASDMLGAQSPNSRRLTELVMTTPSLASRSLRQRLRWEREVAGQLAKEDGRTAPTIAHTVAASVAVSCLVAGLRYWAADSSPDALAKLVRTAFRHAIP